MADIKNIIAHNIISLRKKHGMTQIDLAEKLNYSDNAVSRWERGEATPSVETLEQISEIFAVPIETLFKGNAMEVADKFTKTERIRKLSVLLLFVSLVWFVVSVIYVYAKTIMGYNLWTLFAWAFPISALVLLPFNNAWGKKIWMFVILSVFTWTLLISLYLQFLEHNIWLIFITGVPVQVALVIWAFIKPKKPSTLSSKNK